jgi:hypothetical protein
MATYYSPSASVQRGDLDDEALEVLVAILERDDAPVNNIVETPRWVTDDVSIRGLRAIVQGGCAVTCHTALQTMSEHGDDVFDYLDEAYGEVPRPDDDVADSWSRMARYYLSDAVELWAFRALTELGAES